MSKRAEQGAQYSAWLVSAHQAYMAENKIPDDAVLMGLVLFVDAICPASPDNFVEWWKHKIAATAPKVKQ